MLNMRDFANGLPASRHAPTPPAGQPRAGGSLADWCQARAPEVRFALLLSPAFAWMAPFDTTEGDILERLAFWGGLLAAWFVTLAATQAQLARVSRLAALSPAARERVLPALAAVPMILIAGLAANAMQGWQVSPWKVAKLYVQVLLIGSLVTLLWKAIGLSRPALARQAATFTDIEPAPPSGEVPAAAAAPLLARLPPSLRGPLLCLQMEDHYVRIHTARGSSLALLRLSDAIAETGATAGRQVHRSWWVADEAVEGFEKHGRTGRLRLRNGLQAPVSQRYAREVDAVYGAIARGEPPSSRLRS